MTASVQTVSASKAPSVDGAALEQLTFDALAEWRADDHAAAFAAFRRTCQTVVGDAAVLRQGAPPPRALRAVCSAALAAPPSPDGDSARRFFERHFRPFRIRPANGDGFLTGYYEPEFAGRLVSGGVHDTPLLSRPDDLVNVAEGENVPGLDPALRAARRVAGPQGVRLEPVPDRAAIEDGALGGGARPLVYLDAVDAFMAHVQGSVRVRLVDAGTDGKAVRRFAYAGRNGHAYTSVARLVVAETGIAPADLTAPKLVAWLRAYPEEARRLMRRNRSYIFFRPADELAADDGPLGGASVQLTPGRAVAIDRRIWAYGLPVWIEARLPHPAGEGGSGSDDFYSLRRLMVAQDTGSAIVGPARADIFFGSGEAAGARAGLVRHVPERFVVFLPVGAERGT
ncbi:membrane-bound lytic murein transglycosylase A [Pseudochelatococcus lubricantis]|uniref:peptidoglycan lytic exotransglycosylase n=1 Tax=Pseudochelatococcus lubricantis TaxID=1538102 RepID=A0ABX0UZN7_9HYPH|nr:MltA domain-containing protein [Pseudochelatococcus lubricantis]NIJ58396.1 membrane-bound lytic murein transglycosylase A [Pseudochelatococcus lubricantis]